MLGIYTLTSEVYEWTFSSVGISESNLHASFKTRLNNISKNKKFHFTFHFLLLLLVALFHFLLLFILRGKMNECQAHNQMAWL